MYTEDEFIEEFLIRTKNKQTTATVQLRGSKAVIFPDNYRYFYDDNTVYFYNNKKLIAIVPLSDIIDVR